MTNWTSDWTPSGGGGGGGGSGLSNMHLSRIAFIGDSFIAQAYTSATNSQNWENIGYVTALRQISNGRLYTDKSLLFAQSGQASDYFLANNFHTLAAASDAGIIFCPISTNDATHNLTPTESKANYTTIFQTLLDAGKTVVTMPTPPRFFACINATIRDTQYHVNSWVKKYAQDNGMICVDPTEYWVDSTAANGDPIAGVIRDGNVHPSNNGTFMIADAIWGGIEPIVPKADPRFMQIPDLYTNINTYGNLVNNGLMAGVSGSAGFGAAGEISNNWNLGPAEVSGMGAVIVSAAKVVRSDGETGVWQQLVISGSCALPNREYQLTQTGVTVAVAGDVLEGVADVEWDTSAENILGVYLEVLSSEGGGSFRAREGDKYQGSVADPLDFTYITKTPRSLTLRTPRITVGAGPVSQQLKLIISMDQGVCSATVRVGRASLRKVID